MVADSHFDHTTDSASGAAAAATDGAAWVVVTDTGCLEPVVGHDH